MEKRVDARPSTVNTVRQSGVLRVTAKEGERKSPLLFAFAIFTESTFGLGEFALALPRT